MERSKYFLITNFWQALCNVADLITPDWEISLYLSVHKTTNLPTEQFNQSGKGLTFDDPSF